MGITLDELMAEDKKTEETGIQIDDRKEKTWTACSKRVLKPARYIGNEFNLVYKEDPDIRFAFAFPDKYEIGMSYVGLQILYHVLNREDGIYCERVFAPDKDMEELMRKEGVPFFSLETKEN